MVCALERDIKFPYGEKWFYENKVGILVLVAGFFYIDQGIRIIFKIKEKFNKIISHFVLCIY